MVSFSTTSNTGPGLSSSAWQLWCEGAWNCASALTPSQRSACSAEGNRAFRSTRLARAAGAADLCFLKQTSPERGFPGGSACTRQRVSSVCHRPLPYCFTPFRRANRSHELRWVGLAVCTQQRCCLRRLKLSCDLLHLQARRAVRAGTIALRPGGALHITYTGCTRERSDSPCQARRLK
jgi:hypothetical protein